MLFEKDTLFGHVIIDTEDGPVYEDDGSKVEGNIRPCFGCGVSIKQGEHDPCIAGLPGTLHACCGHGRQRTLVSNGLSGYVALRDGRRFEFAGSSMSGDQIRQAVELALAGEDLPAGFTFTESMWWQGLTDEQVAYVNSRQREGIFKLVRKITGDQFPADEYLENEALFWADGVSAEHKSQVLAELGTMLNELVAEALEKA